jgi:glucan phosphoethanolaminetransferase (alkaline phosphatase superfamily)
MSKFKTWRDFMKGFTFEKAFAEGFYFLSWVGRRCKLLWGLFFAMWGLMLGSTILSNTVTQTLVNNQISQNYSNLDLGVVGSSDPAILESVLAVVTNPWFYIPLLIVTILTTIIEILLRRAAILSHRFSGEDIEPSFFKVPWKVILNYFWLMLLFGLLQTAGFLLFIIPGMIWTVTYALAPFMLLDKQKGTIHAFRMTHRLINGVRWSYFASLLLIGVIVIVFILALTIPVNFLFPESTTTQLWFSFQNIWSTFLTTFVTFYLIFFNASIYRQLIESIKYNPSIDPIFVQDYFVTQETSQVQPPDNLEEPAIDDHQE